jgi:hypothetical protein
MTDAFDVRVVKGTPDDDEIAALVAAFAVVRSRSAKDIGGVARSPRWRAEHRTGPLPRGAGAWARSLRSG